MWSEEEHDRFLVALKLYPEGPWKAVADHVKTRSARQTHAQRYYAKVVRRVRGLRKGRKRVARSEHRLDDDMAGICEGAVDGDAVQVHRHPSRRELNVIVMRRRDGDTNNSTSTHTEGTVVIGGGADTAAEELLLIRRRDTAEESSDSLSSLDDEDLDYLLGIIASMEYGASAGQ